MELFKTWKKYMVLYGLKSQIGTVYRNSDRTTSFYDIGNFLYLAGELDSRFWEDFVRQYGYGLSCGLFIIYIPMGDYPDSFFIRSKEIISTYQDVLDNKEVFSILCKIKLNI